MSTEQDSGANGEAKRKRDFGKIIVVVIAIPVALLMIYLLWITSAGGLDVGNGALSTMEAVTPFADIPGFETPTPVP